MLGMRIQYNIYYNPCVELYYDDDNYNIIILLLCYYNNRVTGLRRTTLAVHVFTKIIIQLAKDGMFKDLNQQCKQYETVCQVIHNFTISCIIVCSATRIYVKVGIHWCLLFTNVEFILD